jgi:hypothetical protein
MSRLSDKRFSARAKTHCALAMPNYSFQKFYFCESIPMQNPATLSRTIWLLAVFVGAVYWLGSLGRSGVAFTELAALPKPMIVATKGLFSVLLALSVIVARKGRHSFLVGVALAISALGDMALVAMSSVIGGTIFAMAHGVAGYAYAGMRRADNSRLRLCSAIAVPALAVGVSFLVLRGSDQSIWMALFPILSGTMAALAILSRFPLWLSGMGAAIFVQSDVLFLVDLGILNHTGSFGFLTWATYAIGYAMVARGAASIRI